MLNWDDPTARFKTTAGSPAFAAVQPLTIEQASHHPSIPPAMQPPVPMPVNGGATGLEEIEMGAARIRVDDKRIINCSADLNQLVPFKYEWAWQKYLRPAPAF